MPSLITRVTQPNRVGALTAFGVFLAFGLLLSWQTLTWPFFYDDLHLIRPYALADLHTAFTGNWDIDNIETPGYRPLTFVFDAGRYVLFGEHVVLQRVFGVVLFAVFLTMLCLVLWQLERTWSAPVIGGCLALCAKASIFHYVWMSDTIHVAQGICFGISALLLLRAQRQGQNGWAVLSALALFAGILVREDTLAVVPVVTGIGVVFALRHPAIPRRIIVVHSVCVLLVVGAFFWLRQRFVPGAQPLELHLIGWLTTIEAAFSVMGQRSFDALSAWCILLWGCMLVGAGIFYLTQYRRDMVVATLWLLAAISACASGLVIARTNLTFFATTFVGLFVGMLVQRMAMRSRPARIGVGVAVVLTLIGGSYVSTSAALSLHPQSLQTIMLNSQFIIAPYTNATIPATRREYLTAQLAGYGMTSPETLQTQATHFAQQSAAAGQHTPDASGMPFLPLVQGILNDL